MDGKRCPGKLPQSLRRTRGTPAGTASRNAHFPRPACVVPQPAATTPAVKDVLPRGTHGADTCRAPAPRHGERRPCVEAARTAPRSPARYCPPNRPHPQCDDTPTGHFPPAATACRQTDRPYPQLSGTRRAIRCSRDAGRQSTAGPAEGSHRRAAGRVTHAARPDRPRAPRSRPRRCRRRTQKPVSRQPQLRRGHDGLPGHAAGRCGPQHLAEGTDPVSTLAGAGLRGRGGGRITQARHSEYDVARVGQYLCPQAEISTGHADRFSAAISRVAFLHRTLAAAACYCPSQLQLWFPKLQVLRSALCRWERFCISGLFRAG